MIMDNLNLSDEMEKEIDEAFKIAFKGKSGKKAIDYIRKLTLESAMMPGCTPDQVMHREGARWLAGVIVERINRGRNPNDSNSRNRDDGASRIVQGYFDRA